MEDKDVQPLIERMVAKGHSWVAEREYEYLTR